MNEVNVAVAFAIPRDVVGDWFWSLAEDQATNLQSLIAGIRVPGWHAGATETPVMADESQMNAVSATRRLR